MPAGQSNAKPKPQAAQTRQSEFEKRVSGPLLQKIFSRSKPSQDQQAEARAKAKAKAEAEAKAKAKAKAKASASAEPQRAEKTEKCNHCGRTYATKANLYKHLRDVHNTQRR